MSNGFISFWQQLPSRMDPVIFSVGSFQVQWYGMMYLAAFGITYYLARFRIRREGGFGIDSEALSGLMTAMILGVLIGGRLGYVLFYNLPYFIRHPLEIVLPFDISNGWRFTGIAGMSFHGGLIGVVVAAFVFLRRHQLNFLSAADLIAPCAPLGYTFGRLGNFINGELYGRITEAAVGMSFPSAPGSELRHPSQLYEAFFEGIVLWAILWLLKGRIKLRGSMLAFYLMGYGVFRFFIEYTREPDVQLGFVLFRFSMGQILCFFMILTGGILLYVLRRIEVRNSE
jgi:phosphatidylglycerol:prolipoprotein diacylglycerol transferase